VSFAAPFLFAGSARAATVSAADQPQQTVVVQMASPAVRAQSVLAAAGLSTSRETVAPARRYILHVATSQVPMALDRLHSDPRVSSASVASAVHAVGLSSTPNDPCYVVGCAAGTAGGAPTIANEAYLRTIGAPAAWAVTHGAGETVAVLDSGADAANPDLAAKIRRNVNICIADDPNCAGSGDPLGHGTHVSGIAAASTDNRVGVASLGWSVRFDMFKVLDSAGAGNTADVASAIYDAVAAGDRVISMSFANFSCPVDPNDCGPDPDEAAAVEYALGHNVVVVAAAGNDGFDSPTYPASYPGVMSVAATDNSGVIQSFSQWGGAADIAAPGVGIVSTWNNNGDFVDTGTSMSTPQVAAAAALMISHNPSLSGPQISELLESTARPVAGGHPINGGVLNVPAALAAEARAPHLYNGYDAVGADGSVYTFGSTVLLGDLGGTHLSNPVVGMALRSNGLGYWLDASDGGVFAFGDAGFHGSTGNVRLTKPVVGMAATSDGNGYWLDASDGGIFAFGDAGFYGSTGNVRLTKPAVGMAATPDGKGYWLVASDGGIFAFGDAGFYGSTGNVRLTKPVVGMAATPDGKGYWLVASDGGIFAFGDAHFAGSTGADRLVKPVVAMASTPTGGGYWLAAADGGIFAFGDAHFSGSTGGLPIPAPVVGLAS
jgi:hypothetical protein